MAKLEINKNQEIHATFTFRELYTEDIHKFEDYTKNITYMLDYHMAKTVSLRRQLMMTLYLI